MISFFQPGRDDGDARFLRLLESAPDAMVIVDPDGDIALLNARVETMFGYERDELRWKPVEILVPERFRTDHAAHRVGYFSRPGTRPMGAGVELFGRRKDGAEFPVEISLSPLETEQGTFAISAIRDITARKRADAEREQLTREHAVHAEANRIKDEFLAVLSHELRTPLNAILGWTSLLLNTREQDPSSRRALEAVLRNARAQTQLIEDLLDVSRVISGKLHLKSEPMDLSETVAAAVDAVRPSAAAKDITITCRGLEQPIATIGDAGRFQQAVSNLLSNAVKFTPGEGRVDVTVERIGQQMSLSVADTGSGITPAFLPFVFERFRQADSSTTRPYAGLGLGLAIARSIVEAHGGAIHAWSAGPGQGAIFCIRLPLPEGDGAARADRRHPHAAQADVVRLDGLRVLVVDDAADERELFSVVLSELGALVETADCVAVALARVGTFRPQVVVTDIAMPGDDGYVLLRSLRASADRSLARIPAIAVTAYARAADRDRALAAKFDNYLSKPVEPAQLARAVAAACGRVERSGS